MTDESSGTVYLLHLDPPLKHARHYTGWTSNLDRRLDAHRKGRGARLMEVVKEAGGSFRLVRTWPGGRALERAIKDRKEAPKLCPECTPQPFPVTRGRAAAARPQAAPEAGADLVPDPGPEPVLLTAWLGRAADPGLYDALLPVTDQLISGWQAQPGPPEPEPEPELELELLPASPPPPIPNEEEHRL